MPPSSPPSITIFFSPAVSTLFLSQQHSHPLTLSQTISLANTHNTFSAPPCNKILLPCTVWPHTLASVSKGTRRKRTTTTFRSVSPLVSLSGLRRCHDGRLGPLDVLLAASCEGDGHSSPARHDCLARLKGRNAAVQSLGPGRGSRSRGRSRSPCIQPRLRRSAAPAGKPAGSWQHSTSRHDCGEAGTEALHDDDDAAASADAFQTSNAEKGGDGRVRTMNAKQPCSPPISLRLLSGGVDSETEEAGGQM